MKYLRKNWGPWYADRFGRGYVHKDVGEGAIKFVARETTSEVELLVSAEKNNAVLYADVNGEPTVEFRLENAWHRYPIRVSFASPVERGEIVEITLDVKHPPEKDSKRLLLWELEVIRTPKDGQ